MDYELFARETAKYGVGRFESRDLLSGMFGITDEKRINRILVALGNGRKTLDELVSEARITEKQALVLVAGIELGMRLERGNANPITNPLDIFHAVAFLGYADLEHFAVITLDGAHQIIKVHDLHVGTRNSSIASPSDVYRVALEDGACAIATAHNHPSNVLRPSKEDKLMVERMYAAGKLIGIPMLDHLIIGRNDYYSFAANEADKKETEK